MSDESLDERQIAFKACSCPRNAGEILVAPKCAAVQCLGGVLFVEGNQYLCKHFLHFGSGHICTCASRIKFYTTYKL